ncbi:hypothetical protein C7999DRAFT_27627 [Corynascus novoguineensis]|uniref:Elongin-A n=1 Tax=Corynascus novoguineensis TaxID=1126955 RepID=A0AAN7D0T7_9PEZI|nr:hypothetical protein C7999DRAFT_27627 [Corynascus novoguineensis]
MARFTPVIQTTEDVQSDVNNSLGPRSLADMCLRVVLSNVKYIQSLSGLPPQHTDVILRHVKTAEQLHRLELNSDDIYDETETHWIRIIKDKFPKLASEHNFVPKNTRSWHKVYEKYDKLEKEQVAAATEKLKQGLAAQSHQKETTIISNKEGAKLQKKPKRESRLPLQRPLIHKKDNFFKRTRTELKWEALRLRAPSRPKQLKNSGGPSRPNAAISNSIRGREDETPKKPLTILSFSDDEDHDLLGNSYARELDDDDLFGDSHDPTLDSISRGNKQQSTAASPLSPFRNTSSELLPVLKQSAKRPHGSEETDTEQSTKRLRGHEGTMTPATSAPKKASTASYQASQEPTRRRLKGLSAAPGANRVFTHKPAPETIKKPAPKTVTESVAKKPEESSNPTKSSDLAAQPAVNPTTGHHSHRGVSKLARSASSSRSETPSGDESVADPNRTTIHHSSQDRVESLSGLPVRAVKRATTHRYPILRAPVKPRSS